MNDAVQAEVDRLAALLVPYLCERTGLSHDAILQVMEAQEEFWDAQPHVMGRMVVLGFDLEDVDDE